MNDVWRKALHVNPLKLVYSEVTAGLLLAILWSAGFLQNSRKTVSTEPGRLSETERQRRKTLR